MRRLSLAHTSEENRFSKSGQTRWELWAKKSLFAWARVPSASIGIADPRAPALTVETTEAFVGSQLARRNSDSVNVIRTEPIVV
jgi:hypothetical protein